ncbi:hypothetical protein MSIMFI_05547 [Mycobacterium simulans]|nr:hypothetical protein MSIMFI_05547 [Mycobacterium simulans]
MHGRKTGPFIGVLDLPGGLCRECPVEVADTVIRPGVVLVDEPGDLGHPGNALGGEDIAWPAADPGGLCPGGHLDCQDAVAAQVEKGVVDSDPVQAEYLGIDVGQDVFHGAGGGAV